MNILSGGSVSGVSGPEARAVSGNDVSGADNVGGGVSGTDASGGDVSDGSVPDSVPYARLNDLVKPPALQRLKIRAVSVFKGYEPVILERGFLQREKGYSE